MNVLDLAINHGLQPKRVSSAKGGEFASSCPMCGGNDRFRIWPEQNNGNGSYWCRQCGIHGDRIQFVIETKSVKYPEACRITGDTPAKQNMAGGGFKGTPVIQSLSVKPAYRPKEKDSSSAVINHEQWAQHAEKLVTWAEKRLPGSSGEALLRSKGIGAETAEKFRIGWISEDIYRHRESWGLPEVISEKTGKPKRLWFPEGLVIPNIVIQPDGSKTIDRIRIRRPAGEPRYYRIPGPDSLQLVTGTPGRFALILESELDAFLMDQMVGEIFGIIAIGTSHAKPDTRATAILKDASAILVALDNDEAGQSAFGWWQQNYQYAKFYSADAGKDPSEAYQAKIDLHAWAISCLPQGYRLVFDKMASRRKNKASRQTKTDQIDSTESDNKTDVQFQSPIVELHELLKKNRNIKIIVTSNRLKIDVPIEWQQRHGSILSRISTLIFFDPSVFTYLHQHGSNNINASNFLEGHA